MDGNGFNRAATGKRLVALFAVWPRASVFPVVLISCGTLALGLYTRPQEVRLIEDFAGLERAPSDMLGHFSRRKLL
jgi:hypothetical protein